MQKEEVLLLTKEEHDSSAGVVGVLPRYEGRHHEPQQSREDSHDCQGCDGRKEDGELEFTISVINSAWMFLTLLSRMARIAAMKKVLSPSSDTCGSELGEN